jgi:hypothetical protein
VLKQNVQKAVDDYRRDNRSGTYLSIQKRATNPRSVDKMLLSDERRTRRAMLPPSQSRNLRNKASNLTKDQREVAEAARAEILPKPVLWLQSQSTRLKEMTRMSGPLW